MVNIFSWLLEKLPAHNFPVNVKAQEVTLRLCEAVAQWALMMGILSQEGVFWTKSHNHAIYYYHSEKTAWGKSLAEAAGGERIPLGKERMNGAEYSPRNSGEAKFS